MLVSCCVIFFFFFNDTATTEIYTLSLHDALPISGGGDHGRAVLRLLGHGRGSDTGQGQGAGRGVAVRADRKSTRLNSSHSQISYAVFCLKKKKNKDDRATIRSITPSLRQPQLCVG